ncbi:hypothetical protein BT93_D0355 [Corymbia citriodora subsp. variegata]|nr:hypothetical protein BT93_D0355 [Corymbia citriodora subsp. variegata]
MPERRFPCKDIITDSYDGIFPAYQNLIFH